jgi:peptidoglycan/xylan/chitin deacetylase (PgdA/CDA1 family)
MPFWKQLLLNLYYCGSHPLRLWNRCCAVAADRVPIAVLIYHRIADDQASPWTISNRTFARHVRWLAQHFDLLSLEDAQRLLRQGANCRPSVCITFDDGYADNCHQAIPLLIKEQIPCTYFVTAENVLDGCFFLHDLALGTRALPNTIEELKAMAAAGIEIGAHCYTHADLGRKLDCRELHYEIVSAKEDLEQALGRRVRYFAFPFGLRANLSSQAFALAHQAGYQAACSAYGGFNFPGDDHFHLQRIPVDDNIIGMKNWTTLDPRKLNTVRFVYQTEQCPIVTRG